MYRVNIKSEESNKNIISGYRYFLTKKSLKKFLKVVITKRWKCDFDVEKFSYITDGIFAWTDMLTEDELWEFIDSLL